ncbi:uncharacterized protein TNCV_97001 [Trichonephila clavipes]|nr:uncharacterized protein TNCV_97001 [Trichonephila clavipes]
MDDAPIVKSVSSLGEGRQKLKNKSSAENLHSFVSSIKEDLVKRERSAMLGKILDKRRRIRGQFDSDLWLLKVRYYYAHWIDAPVSMNFDPPEDHLRKQDENSGTNKEMKSSFIFNV